MNWKPRLEKLAGRVEAVAPLADRYLPVTDADWLATFERVAADGVMSEEPDLPRALADYRAAIESAGDALHPPADFRPGQSWASRVKAWQAACPIPALDAARARMVDLFLRSTADIPPVSEASSRTCPHGSGRTNPGSGTR